MASANSKRYMDLLTLVLIAAFVTFVVIPSVWGLMGCLFAIVALFFDLLSRLLNRWNRL